MKPIKQTSCGAWQVQCPKCGASNRLVAQAKIPVRLREDGAVEIMEKVSLPDHVDTEAGLACLSCEYEAPWADFKAATKTVTVEVEGGCVTDVILGDHPDLAGAEVVIIDHDNQA